MMIPAFHYFGALLFDVGAVFFYGFLQSLYLPLLKGALDYTRPFL